MRSRTAMLALLAMAGLIGCGDGASTGSPKSATTAKPPATTPAPEVTIRQDKSGRTQVDGAPLRGDPKACAAFKRCCANPPSSDFGLMCGMAQASSDGDCTKALATVNAYAKDTRKPVCK